jgi:hypothetical protein
MDGSKIGPGGTRVRCSKCQTIFTVQPEKSDSPAATAASAVQAAPAPAKSAAPAATMPNLDLTDPGIDVSSKLMDFLEGPTATAPAQQNKKGAAPPAPQAIPPPPTPPSPREKKAAPTKQPPKPAQPPKLPLSASRIILEPDLPPKERAIRSAIVGGVMFCGILLGLGAMGVKPTPTRLRMLFQYGVRSLNSGVQIVTQEERILTSESGQKRLGVWGKIYNASTNKIPPKNVRLQVLSPSGEFLTNRVDRCCKDDLKPRELTPFYIEVDLPTQNFGSYQLTLEN